MDGLHTQRPSALGSRLAWLALGCLGGCEAQAAEPAAAPVELSEVVITARKRDERLLDVPLAVSVLDQNALEQGSVRGLADVAARVPGLAFEPGILLPIPILRGQWQPSIAGDNVGIFVDGVYQANRTAIDVELLDLARVEVVPGPQSALFGHSTFAGAINYLSNMPSARFTAGATTEIGSGRWRALKAWWSGPLGHGWAARVAGGIRAADGYWINQADGRPLGGLDRRSLALTLQRTADGARWHPTLRVRMGDAHNALPPINVIEGNDYNCGSRDAASGLWSYYCGRAPVHTRFDLSPGVPDGSTRTAQLSLQQSWSIGGLTVASDTSYYRGFADVVRDFDGTRAGQLLGVCTTGLSCPTSAAALPPVNRLVRVNEIQHLLPGSREWMEELRLSNGAGARVSWMIGAAVFRTRDISLQTMGVTRGDLAASEQLTALLPGTPTLAGPVSLFSRALVGDPAAVQVDQSSSESERLTSAVFGSGSIALGAQWRASAELRWTRERLELDNRTANFAPGFGRSLGPRVFRDATPRASLEYRPATNLLLYLSGAKGSRSGGINAVPNLLDSEQTFQPEFNWTGEAGMRWQGAGAVRGLQLTGFYIDMRDTQILGYSNTPQVSNLITRNTAGIVSRGVEAAAQWQPAARLHVEGSASWTDATFRAGSEDPGALVFCGVSGTNRVSSFCSLGPPRNPALGAPALVPWIDGNFVGRVPRLTWHTALLLGALPMGAGWQMRTRLDADYQSDKFERAIEALRFGSRLLVDARWTLQRAAWSVELWGRNLGNTVYISTSAGQSPQFYPSVPSRATVPRPVHVVVGDGRRFGLTLRYVR